MVLSRCSENLYGRQWVCPNRGMKTPPVTALYKRYRFPAEIISYGVWLYLRFCLSYRDVEELMAERGLIATYEIIRVRHEAY